MNRAEATLALIAGKKVERVFRECTFTLRWDPVHGIQRLDGTEWWNESGCNETAYDYREVFEPRVFLDVWEEVETFEEAEPAGHWRAGEEVRLAYQEGGGTARVSEFAKSSGGQGWATFTWVKRRTGK